MNLKNLKTNCRNHYGKHIQHLQILKVGTIILGIRENFQTQSYSIEGIENHQTILNDLWNTINNKEKISCNILDDDNIEVTKINGKTIIVITVPRANRKNKPIYINNNPFKGTYKRLRGGDYKCKEHEVRTMLIDSSDKSKDSVILEEYNIDNIDKKSLKDYRIRFSLHKGESHEWNKLNDEEFLYMLNAMDRKTKKLTIAGLLMFGKERDITQIFPSYFLDYREVKGYSDIERWSNRITSWDDGWSGNLWDFFEKIVNKLTADIEVPFSLDEKMMRIDDTPIHNSIREALTNCLIHTQFDESGSILVEKRENYFKFANPGNMRISIEDALKGGQSDPRNPLLHRMFSYLGYGERAGSGLSMINRFWQEKHWKSPEIVETFNPNRTTLTLTTKKESYLENYPESYPENCTESYPENLNDNQIKILKVLKENPEISRKEISEKISTITEDGVKWNIKKLKEKGIIERVGSDRKGYWKLNL